MSARDAVWVDTDMGVDDLFAILALAAHLPVAGLSLSFGCASLPRVVENAFGAARVFRWDVPIRTGAARPILGPVETAERILGPRGMPSRGATLPVGDGPSGAALDALARWIDAGGTRILALGPLTNLATLALARPDLTLPPITWMGGSLGAGNHTPDAEFNAFADPVALAVLLDRGAAIRMIDLDACRQVRITSDDVDRVAASDHPQAALLGDLLGGYLDIGLSRGRASMALYDPVAAAALVLPDAFDEGGAALRVEMLGPRRGRTFLDPDAPPNVRIVTGLRAERVRDWCLSAACAVRAPA